MVCTEYISALYIYKLCGGFLLSFFVVTKYEKKEIMDDNVLKIKFEYNNCSSPSESVAKQKQ